MRHIIKCLTITLPALGLVVAILGTIVAAHAADKDWKSMMTVAERHEKQFPISNPWNNRFFGDSKSPVQPRLTSLALPTVITNAPFPAAGWLGPVTVQISKPNK